MDELMLEKAMFGDKVAIIVYDADHATAQAILDDAYDEGLRLQKIFNIFDATSELSRLNRIRSMIVSKELLEVIGYALKLSFATDGAYDISKGINFAQRKQGKPLSKIECSYKDIVIRGQLVTLTHADAFLDLGSIAKGFIADKISEFLKMRGLMNGMVDARGDIIFFGNYSHKIAVQHPREDSALGWINIRKKGIATSGDYKQFINDYSDSHILNQKEAISITTISDSLMVADAFATALFVIDEQKRRRLLDLHPEVLALVVDKDLACITYNGLNLEHA